MMKTEGLGLNVLRLKVNRGPTPDSALSPRLFVLRNMKTIPHPSTKEFLLSKEWKNIRNQGRIIYGCICVRCGVDAGKEICMDHVKSRKFHPELALDLKNLQPLCSGCNFGKSNDDTDYRNSTDEERKRIFDTPVLSHVDRQRALVAKKKALGLKRCEWWVTEEEGVELKWFADRLNELVAEGFSLEQANDISTMEMEGRSFYRIRQLFGG